MSSRPGAVHREPVWRERSDFIIRTKIEPGGTGIDSEQLWARQVDPTHYELCCIPFFSYDLALGDIVETDTNYDVLRVTTHSGRFVFRIWFGDGAEAPALVMSELQAFGVLIEWSSKNLVAVDAVDTEKATEVAEFLTAAAGNGRLIWEPGKTM